MNSRKLDKVSELPVKFSNIEKEEAPLPSAPPAYEAVSAQYPQTSQIISVEPPAIGETSIVMMGDIAYEQTVTPSGPSLVRRTLGSKSSHLTCQFCKEKIDTVTEKIGPKELMGEEEYKRAKRIIICFLLIPPGCLLFPCVYCSFFNVSGTKHICPSCEMHIGIYINGTSNFFYTAGTKEAQFSEMRAQWNRRNLGK